ncbi:MAG: SDR family oxidoreductase [Candidatus Moraniibacteriota bacterium]|nr:MAG: SDR family oxidoreductase [Candidatus Moranbacteria bacterium]
MEIKDKVVIITGASGGIGSALSKHLAQKGARLALAAHSEATLKALEQSSPGSLAIPTDVRRSEDAKRLVDTAVEKYGRVDILINLAGQGMWAPVEKIDVGEYKKLFDLNVCGYLRMMQAVIPVMRAQGSGAIINVSSKLTTMHFPNEAGYASTKYAVNDLTLTARQELEKDGIIVSLIRPKLVQTDFGKHSVVPEPDMLRDEDNPNHPPLDTPETVAEKIGELIRSGDAELDL